MSGADLRLRELERAFREGGDPASAEVYARALRRAGRPEWEVDRVLVEGEDHDGYLAAVRRLPRPTAQQIADFACFVATCHSWYKHLRYSPPHSFRFYLAPVPDGYCRADFHYAYHPLPYHITYFGHFEYFQDEGRGSPPVEDAEGREFAVPSTLLRAGTGMVNAFLQVRQNPNILRSRATVPRLGFDEWEASVVGEPSLRERLTKRLRGETGVDGKRIGRAFEHAAAEHERQLAELRSAMHRVCEIVFGEAEDGPTVVGRYPWFHEQGQLPHPTRDLG